MQVLLAKLKADSKFYAVKVLQKKVILKKKEVGSADHRRLPNAASPASILTQTVAHLKPDQWDFGFSEAQRF